ncbi:MAG: WbuC family cupin fold metalloprotein [Nitrospirales bacterium]
MNMHWYHESDEVLYSQSSLVSLSYEDVNCLKTLASHNKRTRARFCAHQSPKDVVHEMVIVHEQGNYIRPHQHQFKSESFIVLEGIADVVLFDHDGNITKCIEIGELSSGYSFFCRIPDSTYHTVLIQSSHLVFLEVTKGPFQISQTVFPNWAPDDNDRIQVKKFISNLEGKVSRYLMGTDAERLPACS